MGEGPTAALLQQSFVVDPLASPSCHGAMRIVAFITQTSVIDPILTHLRTRASREAHAGPRSPSARRIVVLADRQSVLPSSLLDGIAAGRVRLVSTDAPFIAIDGVVHTLDMGDGVTVHLRRSKSARFGVAIAADTVVPNDRASRVAIALGKL